MTKGTQVHNFVFDFKPLCGISVHRLSSRLTTIGVRLRLKRLSITFASMERTRSVHEGAFHCARTSSESPRRTASQPPCTVTRRTKEASVRSKARGKSYGFSESKSGTRREAATEDEAEISKVAASVCIPETTNRQSRCDSVVS